MPKKQNTKLRIGKTSKKLTRAERGELTRESLLQAAAEIVGEIGYRDASITLIAQRAGVANGTFYNYFDTRQELFDVLLPSVGENLLSFLTQSIGPEEIGIERERKRYRAYVDFCRRNPGFSRILDEAAIYSPVAFQSHIRKFAQGYIRALNRGIERREIQNYEPDELPAIVFMLMGARSYFNILNENPEFSQFRPSEDELEETYIKLLANGLFKNPTG